MINFDLIKGETTSDANVAINAKQLATFQTEVQQASKNAVVQSMSYAEQLAKDMTEILLGQFQERLDNFGKPRVMSVQIDNVERKLKHSASPHLPRMLINAKLGINTLLVGPAQSQKHGLFSRSPASI